MGAGEDYGVEGESVGRESFRKRESRTQTYTSSQWVKERTLVNTKSDWAHSRLPKRRSRPRIRTWTLHLVSLGRDQGISGVVSGGVVPRTLVTVGGHTVEISGPLGPSSR